MQSAMLLTGNVAIDKERGHNHCEKDDLLVYY